MNSLPISLSHSSTLSAFRHHSATARRVLSLASFFCSRCTGRTDDAESRRGLRIASSRMFAFRRKSFPAERTCLDNRSRLHPLMPVRRVVGQTLSSNYARSVPLKAPHAEREGYVVLRRFITAVSDATVSSRCPSGRNRRVDDRVFCRCLAAFSSKRQPSQELSIRGQYQMMA